MKEAAKEDRLGNYATRLLERALLQIVRDTDNPIGDSISQPAPRCLRHGGFQGVIYIADKHQFAAGQDHQPRASPTLSQRPGTPTRT